MRETTTRKAAAEATREAILTAAEALFAAKGYDATSIQEICDQAGVARGTPGYFFGAKEELYKAVLARTFALPQELVTFLREQMQRSDANPDEILQIVIERIFDAFVLNPSFVRITQWEGLQGGRYLGELPVLITVLRDTLKVLCEDLSWQEGDAEQFLIDLVALCWFPVAHANTFLKPLGVEIYDPDFLDKRKQHVVTQLLGYRAKARLAE